jgi:hypothetical protein
VLAPNPKAPVTEVEDEIEEKEDIVVNRKV